MIIGSDRGQRSRTHCFRPGIAVIGAGVAGLVCARTLSDCGYSATVFDKGRRPGGRVATRRAPGIAFDHGAQYFTAEDDGFRAWTNIARQTGVIAPWDGNIVSLSNGTVETATDNRRRWLGVPGMSAVAQYLSAGLDIRCGHGIAEVVREGAGWRLVSEDRSIVANADLVVVAVPAPQAISLLTCSHVLASRAAAPIFAPCWAVMLGFDKQLPLPFDGAFIDDSPLSWISRNRSKPGRTDREAWVLHASPTWSREHLEADHQTVSEELQRAFWLAAGHKTPQPAYGAVHRWRYGRVETPVGEACLFDPDLRIGACGDWCLGGKIEAAFASGRAMADRIVADLGSVAPTNRLNEKE
jgi:hypothetical protein